MKKRLMVLLALLLAQTTLQATWVDDVKLYYAVARYVVIQKIKSWNIFGKAVSLSNDDFDDDEFSFEPVNAKPATPPTFKIYRKKRNGSLILPQIRRKNKK